MYDVLPEGYKLQKTSTDRILVKYGDKYIVTKYAGNAKWFKGTSPLSERKAIHWINKFVDGDFPEYEVK
jgi:hypothetical protein